MLIQDLVEGHSQKAWMAFLGVTTTTTAASNAATTSTATTTG